jgi:NADPH:quinone reductase-like Zn-dependent oxidoreductase
MDNHTSEPSTPSSDMWWTLMKEATLSPESSRLAVPHDWTTTTLAAANGKPSPVVDARQDDTSNAHEEYEEEEEDSLCFSISNPSSKLVMVPETVVEEDDEDVDDDIDDDDGDDDECNGSEPTFFSELSALSFGDPAKAPPLKVRKERITITKRGGEDTASPPLARHKTPKAANRSKGSTDKKGQSRPRKKKETVDPEGSGSSTTDKFLDILEEQVCTLDLNSPSVREIEKSIEASWKEIEARTSEFLKSRRERSSRQEEEDNGKCLSADESPATRRSSRSSSSKQKSIPSPERVEEEHDVTGNPSALDEIMGTERMLAQQQQQQRQQQTVVYESEDDENDDDHVSVDSLDVETTLTGLAGVIEQSNTSKTWYTNLQDTQSFPQRFVTKSMELNPYPDTKSSPLQQQPLPNGNEATLANVEYSPSLYNGSTFSTKGTVSILNNGSPQTPKQHRGPADQKSASLVKKPRDTTLTILEPTTPSSLLVKSSQSLQTAGPQYQQVVLKSLAGESLTHMTHDDGVGTRRCFSPNLGKKKSFGLLANSGSTASTSNGDSSRKSISSAGTELGYTKQYEANSHHAYVAYFERGTKSHGALRLYEHPTPPNFAALDTEIVVRIAFSTISHTDCGVRRGDYWGDDSPHALNLPIIPGVAFSGYVTQLNRSAMRSGLRYGDRVLSLVRYGANARHLCIPRDRVVTVPDELKDDQRTACLPEIYLGAFQALHMGQKNGARYKNTSLKGNSVLILNGATILGKALIELCHAGGAKSVYATGRQRHFSILEKANALPLNRDPRHWYSLLKDRIDLVVGLDNESFDQSEATKKHLQVLSTKGIAVLFGAPDSSYQLVEDKRKIVVYNVFDSWEKDVKLAKRDLTHLCKLLIGRLINPHVLESIPLGQIAHAHDSVEHGDFSSFLLCNPWIQTKRQSSAKVVPRTVVYAETVDEEEEEDEDVPPPTRQRGSNQRHSSRPLPIAGTSRTGSHEGRRSRLIEV